MALKGTKVLEVAGLAPAPFCGLVLSDFGAEVLRVDRPHNKQPDCLTRGKKSIYLDLKASKGKEIFKRLSTHSDVLIEPFRPLVMEKLGLGPNDLMATNQKLVYARLSGYGQTGPMAKRAGHDINYLAISGILSKLGTADKPIAPLNIVGDFAGGGLMCALGICMALLERTRSGKGQIVDQSITEGAAYASSWVWASMSDSNPMKSMLWPNPNNRTLNMLSGGAPFYGCFRTKDNKFMSVGAIEPQFYDRFAATLGLDTEKYNRLDIDKWDDMSDQISQLFATKTQSEWTQLFEASDACVEPVLDFEAAATHEHNRSRGAFLSDGTPKPSPVLSRTPAVPSDKPEDEVITKRLLLEMGYSQQEIDKLAEENVIEVEHNSKL